MKRIFLIAIATLLLTVPAIAQTVPTMAAEAAGPSFACASVRTAIEKAICADPALATADRDMTTLFALARTSAFGSGPSNELAAQRNTLTEMRTCERTARSLPIGKCLAGIYAHRNFELATAVLMWAPERALPILQREAPGFAPVLEAVSLWAREPVEAPWAAPERAATRKRIVTLLSPYLAALQTDESQSLGWSILSQPGGDGPAVTRIDDIFMSDRHFATFLSVLGPYLPDDGEAGGISRDLPCSAFVKHPDLLKATAAVFGSTLDSFSFRTDCERTLPPLPALTALDRKIIASWPNCDGTIRFAAYRSYTYAVDAARLAQSRLVPVTRPDMQRRATVAEIGKVHAELAGYYATYFGKSLSEAKAMAGNSVTSLLSTAHSCGS